MNQKVNYRREIISNIERYAKLKRVKGTSSFLRQLGQVQKWQNERMNLSHQAQLENKDTKVLISYFLDEIYTGVDLSDVISKLEKTITFADKFFSNLELVSIAIEFNALTGELDERITTHLFQEMNINRISKKSYNQALLEINDQEDRVRQLELIRQFASGLDALLLDPSNQRKFKMAKYPAKLAGLGSLYQLFEDGFKAMLSLNNPERIIKELLSQEKIILDRYYLGA